MADGDSETQPGDWVPPEGECECWRDPHHFDAWPEELAGPEYWAYRRREEVERVVSELVGERTARER